MNSASAKRTAKGRVAELFEVHHIDFLKGLLWLKVGPGLSWIWNLDDW